MCVFNPLSLCTCVVTVQATLYAKLFRMRGAVLRLASLSTSLLFVSRSQQALRGRTQL